MHNSDFRSETPELTRCDTEQIHLLGRIQEYGCLLAFSYNWQLVYCSQNLPAFLGVEAADTLGKKLESLFASLTVHAIKGAAQTTQITEKNARLFSLDFGQNKLFDVSVGWNGIHHLVELEPSAQVDSAQTQSMLQGMASLFEYTHQSQEKLLNSAVRHMRQMTGYDRVMIYRFLPDGSGEVVAESTSPGTVPYLGLRYPASDIPKQARQLYKVQLLRIIADVDSPGIPILALEPNAPELDLSQSITRAVSPVHLQYLKNMEVGASLSVSIVVDGTLWGLIACHHLEPKTIPFYFRTNLELFGQMLAMELGNRRRIASATLTSQFQQLKQSLLSDSTPTVTPLELIATALPVLRDTMSADGALVCIDGKTEHIGDIPDTENVQRIMSMLILQPEADIVVLESLQSWLDSYDTSTTQVSGMLAIPLAHPEQSDYLLLFRNRVTKNINWAGQPVKEEAVATQEKSELAKLSPRTSFASWQESHDNESEYWSEEVIEQANSLKILINEVILQKIHERQALLIQSRKNQSVLISELNHRVRNILNLVKALVSQSSDETATAEEFIKVVMGRIQSLSSAHDQLTSQNSEGIPLKNILSTEIQPFNQANQVTVLGDEVSIRAHAATCLVLVVHELFTNAVKYGALSIPNGQLLVSWWFTPDGNLAVSWREFGLNNLTEPEKKGFGSTLINQSVPHELGGTANIRYNPEGVDVQIGIPAQHYFKSETQEASPAPLSVENAHTEQLAIDGPFLVVEDNFLIATDTEEFLRQNGAQYVIVVSNETDALQALIEQPKFVILDYNLGSTTSDKIARKLMDDGVPFLFTTGYGASIEISPLFETSVVLQKPYGDKKLVQQINRILAKQQ